MLHQKGNIWFPGYQKVSRWNVRGLQVRDHSWGRPSGGCTGGTEALSTRARAWGEVGVKSQGYSPAECLDQSLSRGTQTSFILQFNQHGLVFLYADCMSVSCFWDVRCIHYTSVENCLRCPDIMTCNLSRPAVAAFEITSKLFLHSWEQILSFTFCLTDRLTEEFWT